MISEEELKNLSRVIEDAIKNVNLIKIKAIARATAVVQFIAFFVLAIKSILNFDIQDVFLAILFLGLSIATKSIGALAAQSLNVKIVREDS